MLVATPIYHAHFRDLARAAKMTKKSTKKCPGRLQSCFFFVFDRFWTKNIFCKIFDFFKKKNQNFGTGLLVADPALATIFFKNADEKTTIFFKNADEK